MYIILLLDDDFNVCNIVADYLVSEGFFIQLVHNVDIALYYIFLLKPHIIITDIIMSPLNGYDLIKIIKLDYRLMAIPVIMVTAKGMTYDRLVAYKLGCHVYLTKPFYPKELLVIIENILGTHNKVALSQFSTLNSSSVLTIDTNHSILFLTKRERVIIKLVLEGYTNKEIAIQLNLSIRNIEKYISKLLSKTCSRNRIELVRKILNLKIIN